jgi:hypothetical protein
MYSKVNDIYFPTEATEDLGEPEGVARAIDRAIDDLAFFQTDWRAENKSRGSGNQAARAVASEAAVSNFFKDERSIEVFMTGTRFAALGRQWRIFPESDLNVDFL